MQENIDWSKLGRYLASECSDAERKEIDNWIASDPEAEATVAALRQIWGAAAQKTNKWDVDKAWTQLTSKAGIQRPYTPGSRFLHSIANQRNIVHPLARATFWRVAAVIVVFLGISYVAIQFLELREAHNRRPAMREIIADKGQRINLRFDDGTRVTLNAGSSLLFPDHFSRERREVTLKGEALFHAARLNGVPFIVKAEGALVEVLGTQFSVRAWPGENTVQVVVAEGRVEFRAQSGEPDKSVILTPGQMSSMSESGKITPPILVDVDKELAWVSGRLLFDKTPFREAVESLERRYGLVCLTPDTSILSRRLTATFKDEPQNVVLEMISLSLDLRYRCDQDTVVFLDNAGQRHHK
jgi:transmembrane sensor